MIFEEIDSIVFCSEHEQAWRNKKGDFHRTGGPAIIESNGRQFWYVKGQCHREDGPAVIFSDGSKKWFLHNKIHRVGGPAVIYSDGTKYWYVNGKPVTQEVER